MTTKMEPRVVRRKDADTIRPFGVEIDVMLRATQTNDTCSVLIGELRPGDGPPPHLHRDHDEYFFVLEGAISLVVDGKEGTAVPNTLVFVPRGTTHSFKNLGASNAKLLEWTVPGGNEPYFRAIHDAQVHGGLDPVRLADINAQFRTEFIAP